METPKLDLAAIASRLNAALAGCGWRADVTFADDCLSVQLSGEPIAPSENPIDPLAEAIAALRASDLGTVQQIRFQWRAKPGEPLLWQHDLPRAELVPAEGRNRWWQRVAQIGSQLSQAASDASTSLTQASAAASQSLLKTASDTAQAVSQAATQTSQAAFQGAGQAGAAFGQVAARAGQTVSSTAQNAASTLGSASQLAFVRAASVGGQASKARRSPSSLSIWPLLPRCRRKWCFKLPGPTVWTCKRQNVAVKCSPFLGSPSAAARR